jgi:hypothetical protein
VKGNGPANAIVAGTGGGKKKEKQVRQVHFDNFEDHVCKPHFENFEVRVEELSDEPMEEVYWEVIEEISLEEEGRDYDEDVIALQIEEYDAVQGYGAFETALNTGEKDFNPAWVRKVREILDSGCSHSMSNVSGRIVNSKPADRKVSGADGGAKMRGYAVGENRDGVPELRVQGMDPSVVLLSLSQYARKGIFIANGDQGSLLEISDTESEELLKNLRNTFDELLRVKVVHGVYEVQSRGVEEAHRTETVLMANHFFNTKTGYTDAEEVIMGYLLMGFTYRALRKMVVKSLVTGIDPRITKESLDEFEKNHGSTPEFFQGSLKRLMGNVKSDEGKPLKPTAVGEYVSVDSFYSDFNKKSGDKTEKLPTIGGATGAKIVVDAFSGFLQAMFFRKGTKSEDVLKWIFNSYKSCGHKIRVLGADSWEVSVSELRMFHTEDLKLLFDEGIKFLPTEAHNHSNGGQWDENAIMLVKQKMRSSYRFVFANPQVFKIGWTVETLSMLWGEATSNSINAINMTQSPGDENKSRIEVFMNVKPDVQQMRMFPMFSIVQAWNYNGDKEHHTNQPHFVTGLVCGTDMLLPLQLPAHGVIRVAVLEDKKIKIIATSKYLPPTLGGGINIQEAARNGFESILEMTKMTAVPLPPELVVTREETAVETVGPTVVKKPKEKFKLVYKGKPDRIAEVSSPIVSEPILSESVIEPSNEPTPILKSVAMTDKRAELDREIKKVSKKIKEVRVDMVINKKGVKPTTSQKKAALRLLKNTAFLEDRPYRTGPKDRDRRSKLRSLLAELERLKTEVYDSTLLQDLSKMNEAPLEDGYFSWYDMEEEDMYYSLTDLCVYEIGTTEEGVKYVSKQSSTGDNIQAFFSEEIEDPEEVYKAVTEGVPKSFMEATRDPVWGDPARKEMGLLKDKVIVKVDREEARRMMNAGCDVVRLFPVYEVKMRDGVEVHKVRLVADGRTHKPEGPTYAATPSREEFLVFLHLIGHGDWEWAHVDESRAFTGAEHTDSKPVLVKISGDSDFWKVLNALYGLKTAPLDYQKKAAARLIKLGFTRKEFSINTYVRYLKTAKGEVVLVIVYGYVDDYFFACQDLDLLKQVVEEFRTEVIATGTNTTEPIWNPTEGLGMEFERDRKLRTISVTMKKKIQEVGDRFLKSNPTRMKLPISLPDYLVREEQFEELPDDLKYKARLLEAHEINDYLAIVGCLLWVYGIRFDISLSTVYLTWFTHIPRVHHREIGLRVMRYLMSTIDEPLVLGGHGSLEVITQTDAALGTATKYRSVISQYTVLGEGAGAVCAKTSATDHVALSSFEAELYGTEQALDESNKVLEKLPDWELDGVSESFKTSARIGNILAELEHPGVPRMIYGDNEKAIEFVKREVETKNLRHANLRLWYMREEMHRKKVQYIWMSGPLLDVNAMTKPVSVDELCRLRWSVLGHSLLGRPKPLVRLIKRRVAIDEDNPNHAEPN